MKYMGQTGRQLKIWMKEHEADSTLDFSKKLGKKKKDRLSDHLKKET